MEIAPPPDPRVERDARGPFVAMAVLCDRVDPRDDGTVDVHGIVDGVVITPEGDDPLGLRPAAELSLMAVVSLRAGEVRGEHRIALRGVYPGGAPGPGASRAIEFTDEAPGASFVVPVELQVHQPGLYTFDVLFDDRLLTRIGLQVLYAPGGGAA